MANLDNIKNYLLEKEFKILVSNNKIDISNYQSIEHISANKVIIKNDDKIVVIEGNNLLLTKLLVDEIIISGIIKNIELR